MDVSEGAGVNTGLIHFHFGNKEDLARVLINEQQLRIAAAFAAQSESVPATDRIIGSFIAIGELVAADPIVQAGVKLSILPPAALQTVSSPPYDQWRAWTEQRIEEGIEDGSVNPTTDAGKGAQFVCDIFLGAHVSAAARNDYASLNSTVERLAGLIRRELTAAH